MKEELLCLIDELKRLRKTGVDRLYVSDESLQAIRKVASRANAAAEKAEAAEALASIPDNIRSASAQELEDALKQPAPRSSSAPAAKAAPKLPPPPTVSLPSGDKKKRWNALRDLVLNCSECNRHLSEGCKVVFGVGNLDADIFFCGEAPGADEEVAGEPFVGAAGELLDKMIGGMGLKREQVYIGNIMNWRPEQPSQVGNRPPNAEEIAFCLPYLRAQIEVVKPKLIVALGATAAKGLLGADKVKYLKDVKGRWQEFEGIPVMPTYHPSYLLRNNTKRDKRSAWEDLLKVMEKAGIPISEKQRGYFA